MSANCPVGLITGDMVRVDPIEYRQPCFRSLHFGYCRGISSSGAERRRYPDQLFVEQHDRNPLGPAAARRLRVCLLFFHLDHVVIGVAVDQFVEWINSRLSGELVDSECELGLFLVDHLLLQIEILPVRI
jgi:hypothetical protein